MSNLVHVQVGVVKPLNKHRGNPVEFFVSVTGPGPHLGYDDPLLAPRCRLVGGDLWVKDLWIPPNSAIRYKFLVNRKLCRSSQIVEMETISHRYLSVGKTPVVTESVFNSKAKKITHAKEKKDVRQSDSYTIAAANEVETMNDSHAASGPVGGDVSGDVNTFPSYYTSRPFSSKTDVNTETDDSSTCSDESEESDNQDADDVKGGFFRNNADVLIRPVVASILATGAYFAYSYFRD